MEIIDSKTYWKNREEEHLKNNLKAEEEYKREINRIYDRMMVQITKEINDFYVKYAKKEGITMAEAKKRVKRLDIEAYAEKAKKYVKNKDFSDEANEEMRLYNLTMKINRLEMLKAQIGLELVDGFDDLQKYFDEKLTERTLEEFKRQAGILGNTVQNNAQLAHTIVNASFHNAKYSERIWMNQTLLKAEISKLLQTGMIQGKNPRVLAAELVKKFGVNRRSAERLMITELARVQTEAQRQSFERNGFEQYEFIALGTACDVCKALDGKYFEAKKMMPGENAPPMHPNCVLPDTKIIAPDIEAMTKSEYSGNIIEIGTANGTRLTVTANHIVLTARGWVRAKNLVKGDKIVSYCGWTESVIESNPTDDYGVPTAEELFASLIKTSPMSSFCMPVSAEDFKGDVIPNSKVDIVFIDSKLRNKLNPSLRKLLSDVLLVWTTERNKGILSSQCTLAEFLMGAGLIADGVMSGKDVASIFLRSPVPHHELIGFRRTADYDSRLLKTAIDNRATDTKCFRNGILTHTGVVQFNDFISVEVNPNSLKFDSTPTKATFNSAFCDSVSICDLLSTFSGLVSLDDVVFVTNKYYSGHVYDASSLSTLYIANGILSSNCRCSTAAHVDREEYDAWLDFLNKGGTTEEWNAKGKAAWKSKRSHEKNDKKEIELNDSTDKWAKEAKKELLKSEQSLGERSKETMEVYDANGTFIMLKRGNSNSVRLSPLEYFKLKDAVVTHNHPSGGSFSVKDIKFLKRTPISELRVSTKECVYYIRRPQQWPKEINTEEKIEKEIYRIKNSLKEKYEKMYNEGKIDKIERYRLFSDEVNKIFAERYDLEYGRETYE